MTKPTVAVIMQANSSSIGLIQKMYVAIAPSKESMTIVVPIMARYLGWDFDKTWHRAAKSNMTSRSTIVVLEGIVMVMGRNTGPEGILISIIAY